jgi:phosphatidylinositol alpha-1,6-mannosyltransferase
MLDWRRPLRVCLISAPPDPSHGWGRYARELTLALCRAGASVSMITGLDAAPVADLPIDPNDYHRILPSIMHPKRFNSARLLAAAGPVRALTESADIVHVTSEPYLLTCTRVRRPLVTTAHGSYAPLLLKRPVIGRLYAVLLRRGQVVCVSSYTRSLLEPLLSVTSTGRLRVIPNGVDVTSVREPGAPVARRGPTVLSIGQLKPRKGFHILARAMAEVRRAVPDAQAVFVGDDSQAAYVTAIREQLAADGLSDAVRITGRVSDSIKRGWLQTAELFAMPALNIDDKFEGFGLVYLEASAAGLPVIGTYDCGAEDAIQDGVTGYLVSQNDEATLAAKIIELLRDAALRQRMGAAGWAFAEENSWDAVAGRVMQTYTEALDAAP